MPFQDVIGHRRIIDLLARAIAGESLPPSLIFAGPAGIGKRLTALSVAQALNCIHPRTWKPEPGTWNPEPGTRNLEPGTRNLEPGTPNLEPGTRNLEPGTRNLEPGTWNLEPGTWNLEPGSPFRDACGICTACARIARGVHPDVLVLEPGDSGSIKVEEVRDVIKRTDYRPFEGKRRVVIVDGADALVPAAQNALLKTLEEPPSLSVFILVTARPDVLLPTVRSRCPRLSFRLLSPPELAEALVARGRSRPDALAVAATADGSLGRALEASAGALVEARDVAQQVLSYAASTPEPRRRIEGAKELLAHTGAGGASDREQLAIHLRAMASLLRDVELLSVRADARSLANPDVRPVLDRLTAAYQGDRGMRAFEAVDRALVALERNASVKIVADWLVLAL